MPTQTPIAKMPDGSYIRLDPATRQWRPLNEGEYGNIHLGGVLNEMGVSYPERFHVKNLEANPGMAQQFLKAIRDPQNPSQPKYSDVVPYGGGFNFAVRRTANDPWKLVDPGLSASPLEFLRDLTDLTTDFLSGAAITAGTAAGGPLGGAAAGAASELARQGIGNLDRADFGVAPASIDPTQVAGQGVAGALAGPLNSAIEAGGSFLARTAGKAVVAGLKGAKRIGSEAAERMLSIDPKAGLSVMDTLLDRASRVTPGGQFEPLPTPPMAVGIIREHLENVRSGAGSVIGRLTGMRNDVVADAAAHGTSVDMTDFENILHRAVGQVGVKLGEPNIFGDPALDSLSRQIDAYMTPPTREAAVAAVMNNPATQGMNQSQFQAAVKQAFQTLVAKHQDEVEHMDPRVTVAIKDRLQSWLRAQRSAFQAAATDVNAAPATASREGISQVERLSGMLNQHLRDTLDAKGYTDYGLLNDELHDKLLAHTDMRNLFGVRGTPSTGAENMVVNALRQGRSDIRTAVSNYDQVFNTFRGEPVNGPAFSKMLRDVGLGLQFSSGVEPYGKFGVPQAFPHLSRVSSYVGAATLGAAGAAVGGGPAGGAAGLLAGGIMASPLAAVKLAPHAAALYQTATAAASRLAATQADLGAARNVTASAIAEASRAATALYGKATADMDVTPPEKPLPTTRRRIDLTQ